MRHSVRAALDPVDPFANTMGLVDRLSPQAAKAFRDTWELRIHSYLTYLRDRLLLCRELLAETGSVFVQINDENLSLVHLLMSEVFGATNFIVHIPVKKKGGQKGGILDPVNDYLIWFAKDKAHIADAYNQLYEPAPLDGAGA